MVFTVLVQYIIVQYGGEFTTTQPLNMSQWLFCVGVGSLSIPVGAILRLIPVSGKVTKPVVEQRKYKTHKFHDVAHEIMVTNSVVHGLRHRKQ